MVNAASPLIIWRAGSYSAPRHNWDIIFLVGDIPYNADHWDEEEKMRVAKGRVVGPSLEDQNSDEWHDYISDDSLDDAWEKNINGVSYVFENYQDVECLDPEAELDAIEKDPEMWLMQTML